jgi:hypothetical protein
MKLRACLFGCSVTVHEDESIQYCKSLGIGGNILQISREDCSLILSDEEAFYLLTHDKLDFATLNFLEDENLSLTSFFWRLFVQSNSSFPALYKVYSFFVDRG